MDRGKGAGRRRGFLCGLALLGTVAPLWADQPAPSGGGQAPASPEEVRGPEAAAQAGLEAAPQPGQTGGVPAAGEGTMQAPPAGGLPPEGAQPPLEPAPPEGALTVAAGPVVPPTDLKVGSPKYGDGLTLNLEWVPSSSDRAAGEGAGRGATVAANPVRGYVVLRAPAAEGPWDVVAELPAGSSSYQDKVTSNPSLNPPLERYYYKVAVQTPVTQALAETNTAAIAARMTAAAEEGSAEVAASRRALEAYLAALTVATPVVEAVPQFAVFDLENLSLLIIILLFAGLIFYYTREMRRGKNFYIRRIPGIDAIEEAIGRATEMGKPILYVPGIDELQDIQTIASMLILGRVAEIVANYESDMIVPCTYPMVREVADEVVRAGYFSAGRPDAYDPKNVRFISSEQFAFCAGTNGIILRQQPAANLYLGRFFAEALIFAETGFVNRSIQIAGTAEPTQLPFFIVSCDYTIIGEELFAVSAYLSRDPRLVSSLRASDIIKALVIISILVGTILSSLGYTGFSEFWRPGGG